MKQTGTFAAYVRVALYLACLTGKGYVEKTTRLCNGNGSGSQWMPRIGGSIPFGRSDELKGGDP